MAKIKTRYLCQQCGAESAKWLGKCPVCNTWNSYVEEVIHHPDSKETAATLIGGFEPSVYEAIGITQVQSVESRRLKTADEELNRVLGGGIVPGSVILIGGEPGIGKSTLMLQLAVQSNYKVLYVSGEESTQQIKMRADRLGVSNVNCFLLTETNLYNIFKQLKLMNPDVCIIDSIQTLVSPI